MISYNGWDREYQQNKEAYLELFNDFMNQSRYQNTKPLEKTFARYIGRKHAIGVSSATDGLHFSLLAHGIDDPNDEVLVPNFSWISTSSAISLAGATPVFCDIDLDSYHLNLDSAERMISPQTRALIYPHLFGNMTNIFDVKEFCVSHGIVFIEDAAQALGSSLDGRLAGTFGDSSVLSFNTNKVIGGINGGGMYLTDNDTLADRVKKLREHGKCDMLGYNSKMYTLNASIILKRFENIKTYQQTRQRIAAEYNMAFSDLPIQIQDMMDRLDHNYHKYVVRFTDKETRDHAKQLLSASVHYDTPLSENVMYQGINHRKDNCMNSRIAADTVLSLPIHAWLEDDEIDYIIDTVQSVFE